VSEFVPKNCFDSSEWQWMLKNNETLTLDDHTNIIIGIFYELMKINSIESK